MSRLRWFLAVLVLGALVAGGVLYTQHRADVRERERIAAAARKEKADVAAYRTAVKALVPVVYDAVQPLQDVYDLTAKSPSGLFEAQHDVLRQPALIKTLRSTQKTLRNLKAPRTIATQADKLDTGLVNLIHAVNRLQDATHAPADAAGYVKDFGPAYDLLHSGEQRWLAGIVAVFGAGSRLPVPYENRTQSHGRRTPTHGNFILSADLICGQAYESSIGWPEPKTRQQYLTLMPKLASELRKVDKQLLALRTSPSDPPGAQRAFTTQISAVDHTLPRGFDGAASALRRNDVAGVRAAQSVVKRGLAAASGLSHAFRDYGANLCAELFEVDEKTVSKGLDT